MFLNVHFWTCHCNLSHLFSATWPSGVRRMATQYVEKPVQVNVGSLDLAVSLLKCWNIGVYMHGWQNLPN